MKIFFEEHHYKKSDVKPWLHDHYLKSLENSEVKITHVGYYFFQSGEESDTVFVLPKVFINTDSGVEKAFGEFTPEEIIDTNNEDNPLTKSSNLCNHIFNLSTWIYRAIVRYKERHDDENITKIIDVQDVKSVKGEQSETMIDIVLRLIGFNNDHRDLFTYIARINSQGHRKINWQKTISRKTPTIQDESPVYLTFFNKTKKLNFDEELLVLFYSVLDYLHEKFNFRIIRNVNYPTAPHEIEQLVYSGKGTRFLRSIRHKYFKDELVELWELLYVFFSMAQNVAAKKTHEESLMVSTFNKVFEDMVDSLVSDDTKNINKKLVDQPDGKIVDHIYSHRSLMSPDDIYYIGDSKYYKDIDMGESAIFKQFTYARNVIFINMNTLGSKICRNQYYDDLTEGYNITPNFFIRGVINPDKIDNFIDDDLRPETDKYDNPKVEVQRHHINRIFDRDTLFVQKYNINFLYVLASYVTNSADEGYKKQIQEKFRTNLLAWLAENYKFFVIEPKTKDLYSMLNKHFRTLLGKVYAYNETSVILGMQSKNMSIRDNVESDLYEVYTAIHDDFTMYVYDVEKSHIKGEYQPP